MSPSRGELARPEFESVDLGVDTGEARSHVEDAVKSLAASEADDVVNYRTVDGVLVAVVGRSGHRDGATLAYRTAPAAMPATRKASRLREALDPYVVG
jgi:hypothetical protein